MGKMTGEEVQAFLAGPPVRTGKLATVRADGRAHVAPIWFVLDTSTADTDSLLVKKLSDSRHPPTVVAAFAP